MTTLPFLIANDWTQGGGEPFDSINPADGSVAARIAGASVADVDRAVAAARRALRDPAWQGLRAHERARLLLRFAELVERDRDVLARAQMMDNGKTLKECRSQAASAALVFRYYAAVCETAEGDVTTQRGAAMTLAIDEPMGVVAAITPWNSPLTIEAQKLAPILAAGNAVVLKPSEVTPQVALHYGKIAIEAGFPAGVVNVVTGFGDVGRALVEHRDVDMVSFTGGTVAGRHIAEAAGRRLCPVLLELGGKSPNVVFADADMAKAARGVAAGIFGSGGQSCVAGSRVFVERAILDDFVARFVTEAAHYRPGHPESDDAAIGPMASFGHRDAVLRALDQAREDGGTIVTGGAAPQDAAFGDGAYFEPTIITGLTNDARTSQQEIFGPVAVVLAFDGETDLIEQANDTAFGLAAGVWTGDAAKAWRFARAVRAGTVWINTYKEASISTPFGGVKQSGIGREKGVAGMRAYCQPKGVFWHLD